MPEIQWVPAIVAGIAGFVLGGLWYSPLLFSKPWQEDTGAGTTRPIRYPMALPMAVGVGQAIIGACVLSWLLGPAPSLGAGLLMGAVLGFLVAGPTVKMNGMFGQESPRLIAIHALYPALEFTLMGLILALWPA